ncbi:MAG: UDP-glucose 4-epimerase GalE [Parvibaculum sp.]|nr:UDP-glucose 4-epimerase GalE [Parvibaculum sp.]|tara:strand:+ start:751 stop:1737 length:987 start_codon:yes stop_codon:yes gene_type:complete
MSVLVTGGAGYIGSHMVLALADAGEAVTVLDNLSTGLRTAVDSRAELVEGDIGDAELVRGIFQRKNITDVVHFAGSIVVPESVTDPLKYYSNNTAKTRNLIECCVKEAVPRFVFSSTAAVYGSPEQVPVTEDVQLAPMSPYGRSKLMSEWMLQDVAAAHELTYVVLRYFNVAGADPAGRSGQSTKDATHLIKVAVQTALGTRDHMKIFGDDYATPDGTGVRDYIHVSDLISAHEAAVTYLRSGGESLIANCGYGHGSSVKQVIEAVERVAGKKIDARLDARRAGDPAEIVADAALARKTLGWKPEHDDLDEIVRHAFHWERKLIQAAG